MSDQPPPADASVAWQRCQMHLDRLFDALEGLDEQGGIPAAAAAGGWRPSRVDKAATSLRTVRDLIDAELARIKGNRRGR